MCGVVAGGVSAFYSSVSGWCCAGNLYTHDRCAANLGLCAMTGSRWGAGFSAVGRFVGEIEAAAARQGSLRAGYVLAGDEIFLLDRCREAVLKAFVPPD